MKTALLLAISSLASLILSTGAWAQASEADHRAGLKIFSAGVASKLARQTVEDWNAQHLDSPAELTVGGSVDGIRRLLAGEEFDLLILADDDIIKTMLMPKYTDGYYIFAGNKMVIAAAEGRDINSDNWQEKLLAPEARFMHMNPYGDPNGYRAVMAILLADRVEPGLSKKLMDHPGHIGMDPKPQVGAKPEYDYMFTYYSGAKGRGLKFAELPPVMDLSDDALADVYATAEFQVDDQNKVKGSPIAHAVTIPLASKNRALALEFVESFLRNDFAAAHFIQRSRAVGNWQPKADD